MILVFISIMRFAVIKKIDFEFNNFIHSALVSSTGTTEGSFIHVQLINSFLKQAFNVEHIRFYIQNGEIIINGVKLPYVHQVAQLVNSQLEKEVKVQLNNLCAV